MRDLSVSPSPRLDGEPGRATVRMVCDILSGRPVDGLDPVEWSRMAAVAEGDRVASLLCRVLDDGGWPDEVPVPVRKRLRRAYFSTAAKNLFIYGELRRILDAFAQELHGSSASIAPVVVLKGGDLALSTYPSLALRPMADLDLLVKRDCWDLALGVLDGLGYRRAVPEITPGHRRAIANDVCLLGGPHESVVVELHWGLVAGDVDWRSPSLNWFWTEVEELDCRQDAALESGSKGDAKVGLPSSFHHFKPTANLLYLAAHIAVQHGLAWSKLLWFYDIHLLVTRFGDSIDWETVLEKANAFQWSGALHAVLGKTREHFGTAFPIGFLDALYERRCEHEAWRFEAECIQPKGSRLWHRMMCLSWAGRFRFAWGHFFPTPAYMRWRYKFRREWLWPLCYPYRWWAIFSEAVASLKHRAIESGCRKSKQDDRVARALKEVVSEQPLSVKVSGDCMAPLARHGDIVEISPARLLLPGDVIAFRQHGRFKLHRLIGYRPYLWRLALVTQGDHNDSCDMHSDVRDVIGRVSGGGCSPLLTEVPLSHRLWALGRFFRLLGTRIVRTVRRA